MIEVAPAHCVVEILKSAGELGVYKEVKPEGFDLYSRILPLSKQLK